MGPVLIAALVACAVASLCTEKCDSSSPVGSQTYVFCGTDGATHNASRAAVVFSDCYAYCGVSVLHVGPCGCPNDCGGSANGACVAGACVCEAGWGGEDCMSVSCAGNTCSGSGTCTSSDGFDYCACAHGFTGPYCGQAVPNMTYPLWNDVLPNSPPQYVSDVYGDNHPILNLSALSTMRITLDEDVFSQYLLYPFNLYNASYQPAVMSFTNEMVQVTNVKLKLRVKGQSTRTNIKKAWDLKFPRKSPFFGLQKLAIKNGNGSRPAADSILKMMLEAVSLRAANVPVSRTAFFVLYVNNRFEGLYYFEETGDQVPFLESRFGDAGGNLMKLHWHVGLKYFGPDPQTYLGKKQTVFDNFTTDYYRQSIGDGDISDFISLLKYLNASTSAPVDAVFDSDSFLRLAVIESFYRQDDNFCDGNNYYMYRMSNNSVWQVFTHDYDSVFDSHETLPSRNVFDYVLNYNFKEQDYNPARARSIINGNATFATYYLTLLPALFPSNAASLSLPLVYATFAKMVYPMYAMDRLQQMSYNENASDYLQAVADTLSRLAARNVEVRGQLAM